MSMNQDFRLESQEPGQAPAWNPLELILLLATRYRRTILIVTVIGVVVSLGLALAVPNRYTSAGQVLVRLGQREQMPTDIVAEDGRVSTGGGRGAVANEYQLLKNPLLFERVARRVGVEEVLRPYDPASWDGESTPTLKRLLHSMQSWWFRTFTDGSAHLCEKKEQCGDCLTAATQKLMSGEATTLRVMPRTDIITVAHTAHDPDLARRITAAFLEVFDERHQEVFATNPALEFLSAQHATATEAAAAADLELARYRAECGVHDYPTQIHNHLNTVHELRKRISNDRGSLNGLETLRVKLEGKTAGLPALVPQPVGPQHVANPDYQILKETLSRLQMELFELRNTYAEDTEVVKAKERAIERVRGDLEGQPQFVALDRPDIQVPNPELTRLRNQLAEVRETHHKLEAELAERESILKNLEEELAFLQTCKPRLDELQQDYQAKRSKAVELTSALDDLKIHNALDEQKVSNLLIIREANRPLSKSGPNRTSYIVMGLAVGLLAGFALAFLRNAIDGTLHRPQDVDRHLGHRILGVVPETRGWRKAQREARQQVRTGPKK